LLFGGVEILVKFDKIIKNGRVVIPYSEDIQNIDLGIKDGKIAAYINQGNQSDADEIIDVGGKLVLPGVIDPHNHLGLGDPETDYLTETRAAALHGVTTLMNFLMSNKPYESEYQSNRDKADSQVHVDYGLHAVISTREQMKEIDKYINEYGIASFKFFMSFRGEEGSYIGLPPIDDGLMYELFDELSRRPGTVVCVHTENIEVVWSIREKLQGQGRDDLKAWHEARPAFVEAEAAARAMMFARETGAAIYIVHTSTRETLEEVRAFRSRGGKVFVETCPHYLTHTYESNVGTFGKQNPPLRSPDDLESMWDAIKDGTIDTIGSDHAPRLGEKKQGTVWEASPGQPNMPVILPILMSEGYSKRKIPLHRIAEISSANVSKIFGLWPQKGSLRIDSDADVIVVDPDLTKTVTAESLQGRADYSIYENYEFTGWPVMTMIRGVVVAKDGHLLAEPGTGQYLNRRLKE
jgi:dihydropyrimidinase